MTMVYPLDHLPKVVSGQIIIKSSSLGNDIEQFSSSCQIHNDIVDKPFNLTVVLNIILLIIVI
jgi:hypothetical protein